MSLTALRADPTYSVIISPSKKRMLDQENFQDDKQSNVIKPTRNQLWKWCLRADAVAQCYVRDVMQLKEDSHENRQGTDVVTYNPTSSFLIFGEINSDIFWWLGSVPCRSVKFVGMLVGAKAYEKRTIYTSNVFLCPFWPKTCLALRTSRRWDWCHPMCASSSPTIQSWEET
jgi:Telomere regulation protein Stn1